MQVEFNIHKSASRGHANHGWLDSKHTFSFANYFNPARIHFGALRVLNDDTVAAGMGFGTHPHQNMEIVSIPLYGSLMHKDSMGNAQIIEAGEIQVMSAGTGIQHSEYNASKTEMVKFLQIWIIPNQMGVQPRYDQYKFNLQKLHNQFHQILSPNPSDEGVWIHQDAWFSLGYFDANQKSTYTLNNKENGVYLFVLEGKIKIYNQELNQRDGIGIRYTDAIQIEASSNSQLLLMEVPMLTIQ
jgi:redox-sensitive bicupin YhaK (pirin superfamily)